MPVPTGRLPRSRGTATTKKLAEARDAGGEVHDRMPVFLTDEAVGEWLTPGKLDPEQKDPLLAMIDEVSTSVASELETYAVDRQVNNVRTLDRSDPSLIEPLTRS